MSKPEFVRARINTLGYDKWMHEPCYAEALEKRKRGDITGKGIWKQLMMNNYFKGKICLGCLHPLQCKCNQFKVTEPKTGNCTHGDSNAK